MIKALTGNIVNRSLVTFLILFGVALVFLPIPTQAAGLVPCGRSEDDTSTPLPLDESLPCTVCHVILGGKGLITWGLGIMTVIAIVVAFAMAVLYVVSAGDQGMMQTAKGGILAALIGFGVMLSAWLIVNIILTILIDPNDTNKPLGGLVQDGTFQFKCDISSRVNR